MNHSNIYRIVFQYIFIVFILFLNVENYLYLILILLNGLVSIHYIFCRERESFNINKIVNLFFLIFFVLANAMQYSNGSIVTSIYISFTDNEYVEFQIVVSCILILYNKLYIRKRNRMLINRKTHDNTHAIAIRYKNGVLIILALIGFFIILYYNNFSFSKLLFRGFSENYFEKNVDFNTQYLLFSNFIRPIPFVCFVCAVISKASLKIKAFLFTIMLFSIFPTGLARNAVAMYWIPVLLLLCRPLRKPNVFILVLLFGLLVIFPFLDNFRYFNGTVRFNFSLDYLDTMNFDASQELMVAMKWNFITYGEQLLGVLLFFVPRSIWPTKPIGSGALLANQQAGTFANISMPYFGEGYINFGILGVIAFTIILAYFSAYMDSRFWNKQKKDYLYSKFGIYYLIFIGAILFILRGDLLSSLSYTLGVICSFYVFSKFGFKPEIKKNHV